MWPGWHTKSTHPGSVKRERRERERGLQGERGREEGERETTGDPSERGEGEVETLTRDKGGREGLNMGGTERCRPTCSMSGEEEDVEGKEGETERVRGPRYVAATGA